MAYQSWEKDGEIIKLNVSWDVFAQSPFIIMNAIIHGWIFILLFIHSPTEEKLPIAARTRKKSADDKSSYAELEFKRQGVRAPWEMLKTNDAIPPRALTVTSVTQSHDLQVPPPPYPLTLLPLPSSIEPLLSHLVE